jgi:hypothetical protein
MRFLLLLFISGIAHIGWSQSEDFTLSGYIRDADSGEELVGANLYLPSEDNKGTVTNAYGFYSLTLEEGSYKIRISYAGYSTKELEIEFSRDSTLNLQLTSGLTMEEVVVDAEAGDENVSSTKMGTIQLPVEDIKKLPALMGEVDVLKSLQLLPGVLSATEGTSGFFVRGGAADQNLVLLDDATIYNPGHLLGFFSVFNADAIKNTTLIKGSLPARYGGRLSSVVDIQMKEGNNKQWAAQGGIGLVSSRLSVEGPIVKDKSSFFLSGRRTYILDLAQPFLKGGNFEGTNYYFYDINAKMNYRISDRDRLYFSGYFGRDIFRFRSSSQDFSFDLPYGNSAATLRWNHLFSDKLFMNVSAIYNNYEFQFEGGQESFQAALYSGIDDYNLKVDWDYYPSTNHFIRFGVSFIHHQLQPQLITATTGEVNFSNDLLTKYGNEYAVYLQDEWKVNARLTMQLGLRTSFFTQLGPYASLASGQEYGDSEPVITYWTPEPRASVRYNLTSASSLKAGIAYTAQYLHLVSNSTSTLPIDIWVPSTERVAPQRGIQYALGYFRNFLSNRYEFSAEVYYRDLYNQVDYRDDYVNNPSNDVELDFVFGDGRAYGLELLLKKNKGDLTGWMSYTLSRTERSFEEIEGGRWYPAFYDRPHDFSFVGMYQINPKWNVNGTFVFGTGNTYTPVAGAYRIEDRINVYYGPRNSARLIPYHRFDFSITYTPKPEVKKRFSSTWNFSIYNIYSRMNPTFIYNAFDTDRETGIVESKAYRVSLFPIIPSISWNFKWNQ